MTLAHETPGGDAQEDIVLTEAAPAAQPTAVAYPRLREDHILGASNLVKTYTPWRVYNALMGLEKEKPFDATGRLDIKMRNWLRQDAEANYGLVVKRFDGETAFEGPFHASAPDVIVDPGNLLGSKGDLLMIQTPAKDAYDMTWKAGYELSVPASVIAKAQIRMAVTGAERTLVWIVSDNGRVNEFEYVLRDQPFIDALRRKCREVLAAADEGREPAPDDVDVQEYALMRAGTKGVKKISIEDEEATAFRIYREAKATLSRLGRETKDAKIQEDNAKRVMLGAMKDGSILEMPDKSIVSMKRVDVPEKVSNAYHYSLLKIETPKTED